MPEPTLEEILAGAEQRIAAEQPQEPTLEDILAGAEQRIGQGAPRAIEMPVQQIEGRSDAPPMANDTRMTEMVDTLMANTAPQLGGASNAAIDWVQGVAGPGMISDFLQQQQAESLGPNRAKALEGKGYGAYRDATRSRMEEGVSANPGAATQGRIGGVAASIPYLAVGGLPAQAAKAGAYGGISGLADTGGDVSEASKRAATSAALTGGLGKVAAIMNARRAAQAYSAAPSQLSLLPEAAQPSALVASLKELGKAAKEELPGLAGRAVSAGLASQVPVIGPTLAAGIAGGSRGAERLLPLAMKAGKELGQSTGGALLRGATSAPARAAMVVGQAGRTPSMTSSAKAQPPSGRMEVDIGEARQLPQVEIGEARELKRPRVEVDIGEARQLPQVEIGEAYQRSKRYDPRALEVVRQKRATEQRNTGIDRVRQAFVSQEMSEPLRAFIGPAIEEGADYKRMAAKLEEAKATPELAAELEKLLGARKGEK